MSDPRHIKQTYEVLRHGLNANYWFVVIARYDKGGAFSHYETFAQFGNESDARECRTILRRPNIEVVA